MIRDFLDWYGAGSAEERKKATQLLGLGIVMTLLSAFSIFAILQKQASIPDEAVNHAEVHALDAGEGARSEKWLYELEKVSMAVMNKKGTRTAYAQFSLILNCPNDPALQMMKQSRAKLLDGIFSIGSQFYLDDFMGEEAPTSFDKFKKLLLSHYQSQFQDLAPAAITLKEWSLN